MRVAASVSEPHSATWASSRNRYSLITSRPSSSSQTFTRGCTGPSRAVQSRGVQCPESGE
jgi:hypothetical protein